MLCVLGSHHVTEIKYLKYTKGLCWSNKVEAGSAVFMMTRSVFLLLGGANLDVVIFCRIWMPALYTIEDHIQIGTT